MESKSTLSRRTFIQRLGQGALGLGAGPLLAACGSGEQAEEGSSAADEDPCTDLSGLTEAEKQARLKTFEYVSESPNPDQVCSNCQFWIPPEGEEPCGGCQIVKGPIDPEGWCNTWAPQQS